MSGNPTICYAYKERFCSCLEVVSKIEKNSWRKWSLNLALEIMMNSSYRKRNRRREEERHIKLRQQYQKYIRVCVCVCVCVCVSHYLVIQKGLVQQKHRMFSSNLLY